MIRRLIFFAIIFFAGFLLYRFIKSLNRTSRGSNPFIPQERVDNVPPPPPPKGVSEEMVFDEMCKSYITEANAIKMEHNGKTLYFCSGACRHMYINSFGINPY